MFFVSRFHPTELYATVNREKVSFSVEAINELHGLLEEVEAYHGHELVMKPTEGLARRMLEVTVWPRAEWERTSTGRLQLYLHQLIMKANIWLFFVKKKILPTQHDSMVSFEYAMLFYYILMK